MRVEQPEVMRFVGTEGAYGEDMRLTKDWAARINAQGKGTLQLDVRDADAVEHGVEAAEPLLRLAAVALDPSGHEVEHLGLEVAGPSLGVPGPCHQPGVLEHPDVLGHGLDRHLVRLGELVHRGVASGEPGDDVAPGRIGQGGEDPGEPVVGHVIASLFNRLVEQA